MGENSAPERALTSSPPPRIVAQLGKLMVELVLPLFSTRQRN